MILVGFIKLVNQHIDPGEGKQCGHDPGKIIAKLFNKDAITVFHSFFFLFTLISFTVWLLIQYGTQFLDILFSQGILLNELNQHRL
ncbi:hypothetical protein SAMN05421790_106177 [Kroppenstedtia eburnea]|uniref:Uncharacterized protein n=1 Tax=Kroppenstedtia eburnea TaxID=714067 RepID=A0A1N7ML68_9BACL|nr:hypothetical protein SAMN05421790_106177 [Kroppenstedtia eburnea]